MEAHSPVTVAVNTLANDLLLDCWQRGGMSLREAGRRMGLSIGTLSRLTRYRTMPDLVTYVAVCRWLGVPLDVYISDRRDS